MAACFVALFGVLMPKGERDRGFALPFSFFIPLHLSFIAFVFCEPLCLICWHLSIMVSCKVPRLVILSYGAEVFTFWILSPYVVPKVMVRK